MPRSTKIKSNLSLAKFHSADDRFPLDLYFSEQRLQKMREDAMSGRRKITQFTMDRIVDHRVVHLVQLQRQKHIGDYWLCQAIESTDLKRQRQLVDRNERARKAGLPLIDLMDGSESGCSDSHSRIYPPFWTHRCSFGCSDTCITVFSDLIPPRQSCKVRRGCRAELRARHGRSDVDAPLTANERRCCRHFRYFKVHWQDWDEVYDTWQVESDEQAVLIDHYLHSLPDRPLNENAPTSQSSSSMRSALESVVIKSEPRVSSQQSSAHSSTVEPSTNQRRLSRLSETADPSRNVGSAGMDRSYWKEHYGDVYRSHIDGVSNAWVIADYCFAFFSRFEILGKAGPKESPKRPNFESIGGIGFGQGLLLREFCAVFQPKLVYGLEPSIPAFKDFLDDFKQESKKKKTKREWEQQNSRANYRYWYEHSHVMVERMDVASYCHRELLKTDELKRKKEEYLDLVMQNKDALDNELWVSQSDGNVQGLSMVEQMTRDMPALCYRLRYVKEMEEIGRAERESLKDSDTESAIGSSESICDYDSSASTLDLTEPYRSPSMNRAKKRSRSAQSETDCEDGIMDYISKRVRIDGVQTMDLSSSPECGSPLTDPVRPQPPKMKPTMKSEMQRWRKWVHQYDRDVSKGTKVKRKNIFGNWNGTFDLLLFVSVGQYLDDTSFQMVMQVLSYFCHYLFFDVVTLEDYEIMEKTGTFSDRYAYKRPKAWYMGVICRHFRIVSNSILESKFSFETPDSSEVSNRLFHIG